MFTSLFCCLKIFVQHVDSKQIDLVCYLILWMLQWNQTYRALLATYLYILTFFINTAAAAAAQMLSSRNVSDVQKDQWVTHNKESSKTVLTRKSLRNKMHFPKCKSGLFCFVFFWRNTALSLSPPPVLLRKLCHSPLNGRTIINWALFMLK